MNIIFIIQNIALQELQAELQGSNISIYAIHVSDIPFLLRL